MNVEANARTILRVDGLSVGFRAGGRLLPIVKDVSLTINRGETLCLVGESGCGKTTLSMSLVGLLASNAEVAGSVTLDGLELVHRDEEWLSAIRGRRVGVVFQDASSALNPVLTIGSQIAEVLERHLGLSRAAARPRVLELLTEVGISDPALRCEQYPHELSGGLKQRVMIAIAIAGEPELLIADEPTTALDVTIQGQVLRLLRRLCAERALAMIFVTHDFGVVARIADRVAVMYAGRVAELSTAANLFAEPLHPYTRALLAANPRHVLDSENRDAVLESIPGSPPSPAEMIEGCAFGPRCRFRHEHCATLPPLANYGEGHLASCWLAGVAP